MACFRPQPAYRAADGSVVFVERARFDVRQNLWLPCGQCFGCRLERSRQWAIRCLHEAQLHGDANMFLTLTYDREKIPGPSLRYLDFQLFMRRLRRHVRPTRLRFYMCGEYGDRMDNPHFHACIFGYRFPDLLLWSRGDGGSMLYRSAALEELWTAGFSTVGDVNFESAAYVARYVMKKINGDLAPFWYRRVDPATGEIVDLEPEFTHMSLKPGIGAGWLERYMSDVYPSGDVVVRGKPGRAPAYYDKKFREFDPEAFEELSHRRFKRGQEQAEHQTDERLRDREMVARARMRNHKRSI